MNSSVATVIFSVCSIIICVIIVLLTIVSAEKRTVIFNANMLNELKNTISIGTTLGDFIACVYNAFGNFNNLGPDAKISVSYRDILYCYRYWSVNNNYRNDSFNLYNYNETRDKIHVLPSYLTDTSSKGWNEDYMFGYEVRQDPSTKDSFNESKRLIITKLNNSYIRMLVDDEEFDDTLPKLLKFHDEIVTSKELKSMDNLSVDFNLLYYSYLYYIIIFKINKKFFSVGELYDHIKNIEVKFDDKKYKLNSKGVFKEVKSTVKETWIRKLI